MVTAKVEHLQSEEILYLIETLDGEMALRLRSSLDLNEYSKKLCQYAQLIVARADDSTIVGLLAFYKNEGSKELFVPYVCVSKQFRRMGIANSLMNTICSCADVDKYKISLEVLTDNLAAITLYMKYSFSIIETNDKKHKMLRKQ